MRAVVCLTLLAGLTGLALTNVGLGTATASPVAARSHLATAATAMPTVTAIAPHTGPIAGGTTVTVLGTGFTGATSVKFGSSVASSFHVVSDGRITAVTPKLSAGLHYVYVVTPAGTNAVSSNDKFTAGAAPTVTNLKPNVGKASAATTVVITGANYTGVTGVKFGAVAGTGLSVISSTSLSVTAPAQAAGSVDVKVTNASGTSVAGSQFTYVSTATVTGLSPSSGSTTGSVVTVTGTNFTGVSAVMFGAVAGTGLAINSSTSLTVMAPPHALGVVDVRVTNPSGISASTTADRYTYVTGTTGAITGTVTDTLGTPLVGVGVALVDNDRGFEKGREVDVVTDANGKYFANGLQPSNDDNSWTVCFVGGSGGHSTSGYADQCYRGANWDGDQYAKPASAAVPVSPGVATTINASLLAAGSISGTVTSANGATLTGVHVTVFGSPAGYYEGYTDVGDIGGGTTDSVGRYSVGGLAPGGYQVCFQSASPGYLDQCYDDVLWSDVVTSTDHGARYPTGSGVAVSAGVRTTGVNAALALTGSISGRIADAATGAPLANVAVVATDGYHDSGAVTAADGTYTVTNLHPSSEYGDYTVCFDGVSATSNSSLYGYGAHCYGATSSGPATAFAIQSADMITGINDALSPTDGAIAGTVIDSYGGTSVQNVQINLYSSAGSYLTSAFTDANGKYLISGLPATDSYQLCLEGSSGYLPASSSVKGYENECYHNVAWTGNALPPSLTQVTVSAGAATTADASMVAVHPVVTVRNAATQTEGALPAGFRVDLSKAVNFPVSVYYETVNGSAQAPGDYTSLCCTLVIPAGATWGLVNVPIVDDSLNENTESFSFDMYGASEATLGAKTTATAYIHDNDPLPALSMADATATHGASLSFTMTLAPVSGRSVTVHYATANGTAKAGTDYTAESGTITLAAGVTTATISVPSTTSSAGKYLTLQLSSPVDASISKATATGRIT